MKFDAKTFGGIDFVYIHLGCSRNSTATTRRRFSNLRSLTGTAEPIGKALKKKLAVSKPFTVATKDDVSKVMVLVSCMDHKEGLPYACMYVLSLNGAAFKTFMGGGLNLAMTPDDMANNFLTSIAQDIVERFDNTNKENLRDALKSYLFLTDTKCNVPTPLQQEFGEKQLTLGQFMIKSQN